MIFKIHSRGAGGGEGPVGYLLGKNRDREKATVLRGNPEQTVELIDSLNFARRYTSGVLSFEEPDIPDSDKQQIMDSLEQNLLADLDHDQYEILWVEHRDKDRLELNFVIPNIELKTGKRLQPYFDPVDRKRCAAWQEITNDKFNLSDPNDPEKRRTFNYGRNLPEDKEQAIQHISNGLMSLVDAGEITDRNDIVKSLEDAGFEVTRQTKKSVSIVLPGETRPTRLKGAIYEQNFSAGAGVREAIEKDIARYRQERESRVQQARRAYTTAHKQKSEYNRKRYQPERTELSEQVERKYQELRKDIIESPTSNAFDIFEWADRGHGHISDDSSIITPIQNHQLRGRMSRHDANQQAISDSNQNVGAEIEHTAGRVSGTVEQFAATVRRYAGAVIRQLAARFRNPDISRESDERSIRLK